MRFVDDTLTCQIPAASARFDPAQVLVAFRVFMRARNPVLLFVSLAVVCSCTPVTSVAPPGGWVRIDAQQFSFYVPPDVKGVPMQGIDSFVRAYEGNSIHLDFDYGAYSDPLDYQEFTGFTSHQERIGGKEARVVWYRNPGSAHPFDYAIGVHFPKVNEQGIRLTLSASGRTETDCESARTIFRTIQFK